MNGKILSLSWNQIPIQSLSQISCVTWNKSLHSLNLFFQLNSGDYNLQIRVEVSKKTCEDSFYWIQESRPFSWNGSLLPLCMFSSCHHMTLAKRWAFYPVIPIGSSSSKHLDFYDKFEFCQITLTQIYRAPKWNYYPKENYSQVYK